MNQDLVTRLAQLAPDQRRAVLQRLQQRRGGGSDGGSIPRLDRRSTGDSGTNDGAASFAQERLWFLWQLAPQSSTYHVPWGYEVKGALDVARLGACVDVLVERYEILRTTLHEVDGVVVQRIGPAWRCGLVAERATAEEVDGLAAAAAIEPFDLTSRPP